jgi:hypothetical protein
MIRRTAVFMVLVASFGLVLVGCGGGDETSSVDGAPAGYATPEALAQAWLDALASGDLEAGKRCYVTLDDIPAIAEAYGPGRTEEQFEERLAPSVESFPALFESCLAEVERQGLDLRSVEIIFVDAEPEVFGENLETTEIVIRIETRSGDIYDVRLDDCIKLERGWVAVEEPSAPGPMGW